MLEQVGLDRSGAASDQSSVVHLPTPVTPDGALSYYNDRQSDFEGRYASITPPDYYLGYGLVYVTRFTKDTSPKLSPDGQEWLVRARVNLQVAIEDRLAADPAAFDHLEKQNDAFRAFAYGTHADAYWSAGLGDLCPGDLAIIGLTPDVEDLLAFDGLNQVADIGGRLMDNWGAQATDHLAGEGTHQQLVDAAYEGMSVVGDGIDEVFGAGTSQALHTHADTVGVHVDTLAADGYETVASVVGAGVDQVEECHGKGAVSAGANHLREGAQDFVDGVQSGHAAATAWVAEVWDDLF